MADEKKKNETTEETPEVEETVVETPAAEAEPEAPAEDAAAPEAEAAAPEPEAAAEPEAEAAEATPAEVPAAEAEPADEPAAPVKKQRSRKHVPRSARRTRTKTVGERGRRQERRGVVISDKGEKTIVVKVDVIKSHPKYKKVVRSTVKFHAHDEANTAGVGDTVRIVETRPLSKTKRWRLAEIVEKAR